MHPLANQLIQLQELTLVRDEHKVTATRGSLQEIENAIKTMELALPPPVRSLFQKLHKKDHVVIVPIHDGACSSCRMRLPISQVQSVRVGKNVHSCPSCARMLYYPEAAPQHVAKPHRGVAFEKTGISRFSSAKLMIPRLQACEKADAIRELAFKMEYEGYVDKAEKLVEEALRRESILSTAVDHGLAFPHVRGVEGGGLTLALGINPKGIRFDPPDASLTHLVFFVVIPTVAAAFYLKLLAGLAEALMKTEARKALISEKDPDKLWKALVKATRATVK